MTARDGASRLLAAATRLLPPARRDWGRAMRAELTGLASSRQRWSFALGCAGTVLGQPTVLRSLAYSGLMLGAVVATVVWSADVAYAPLRWSIVALVGTLVAVSWLGRVSSPLGPVSDSRTARIVRSAGFLMVGIATLGVVAELSRHDEEVGVQVPVLGAVLACYLIGFAAVTADRSPVTARMLITASGAGLGGALLWLGLVVLRPPIPPSSGLAVEFLIAAMGVAACVPQGRLSRRVLVALFAGSMMSLLLLIEVVLLSTYGPAAMIPDLARAALTPADDLAQSRGEVQDPYVAVLFLGSLIAFALCVASLAPRPRPKDVTAAST